LNTMPATMQHESYATAFIEGYAATRRFLVSRGAPIEDAEEIAQAAWVRGWEYRNQLRDPHLVGFWVNAIARNLFRARFRLPPAVPIESANPSYSMDLDSIDIKRLLEGCSERDRALLERSLEGYSAEEMAHEAGITSTGVRVRLLRARQAIRHRLDPVAA